MTRGAWPSSRIAELRRVWKTHISTDAIAIRFGTTKGAIVGKANRLGLPNRVTGKPRLKYTSALAAQRAAAKRKRKFKC